MSAYFDTSALVAVYVTEVHSARARQVLERHGAVPFTWVHRLELHNAFELLVGRGLLSSTERDALVAQVDVDRQAGRLAETPVEWETAFDRARGLSQAHTRKLLTRSLDVLHIALALGLGSRPFVSGDARQLALARKLRLRVIDITTGAARPARRNNATA